MARTISEILGATGATVPELLQALEESGDLDAWLDRRFAAGDLNERILSESQRIGIRYWTDMEQRAVDAAHESVVRAHDLVRAAYETLNHSTALLAPFIRAHTPLVLAGREAS